MEFVDPDICSSSQLLDLMANAPDDLALGFLIGKLTLRQQIAEITGRPFL